MATNDIIDQESGSIQILTLELNYRTLGSTLSIISRLPSACSNLSIWQLAMSSNRLVKAQRQLKSMLKPLDYENTWYSILVPMVHESPFPGTPTPPGNVKHKSFSPSSRRPQKHFRHDEFYHPSRFGANWLSQTAMCRAN